jgi:formylglycine-generating enzyme required for sulfatase activity
VMGPDRWGYCRSVLLTQRFGISRYQLTLEQYSVWDNLESASEKSLPVCELSWLDCYFFLVGLSGERVKLSDGLEYRFTFPTEACWEYACRAGNTTDYCYGEEQKELAHYAWFSGNSDLRVHPVGEKLSNAWGLHDMLGNVREWCWDWYAEFPANQVTDPLGPDKGPDRVIRGGSWYDEAADCRSANRSGHGPSYRLPDGGFRLALSSSGIPRSPEADK